MNDLEQNAANLSRIEISIEEARESIALKESLERLINNKDFKSIIDEGYFEKEAIRLVLVKADPNLQKEFDQKEILMQIDAIGRFRGYLSTIMTIGASMENSIKADQETKEELLAEQL